MLSSSIVPVFIVIVEWGGLEAPLSFKMTQWSCYCIGESVCYRLEKGNSMDTWRRRTHNTWRWRTTLIKSERCYWVTASLYRKYNTFSDRESEEQHRTMNFVELPNHPLQLTMLCLKMLGKKTKLKKIHCTKTKYLTIWKSCKRQSL